MNSAFIKLRTKDGECIIQLSHVVMITNRYSEVDNKTYVTFTLSTGREIYSYKTPEDIIGALGVVGLSCL